MTHPQEPPGPPLAPPSSAGVPAASAGVPARSAGVPAASAGVPAAEIVEWGNRTPRGTFPLAGWRGRRLPVAWPLAGLGAVALFASTIGDWQLTRRSFNRPSVIETVAFVEEFPQVGVGVAMVGAWGLVWLIGAAGLAICVWLTLFGIAGVRAYTRSIGLATAGVLLGLLAAAAVSISTDQTEILDLPIAMAQERQPGWGLLAAFVSALLLGAALWQARVPAAAAPATGPATAEPATAAGPATAIGPATATGPAAAVPDPTRRHQSAFDGPPDLAVGPAEPFARPDEDRHRQ